MLTELERWSDEEQVTSRWKAGLLYRYTSKLPLCVDVSQYMCVF